MRSMFSKVVWAVAYCAAVSLLAASVVAFAQDPAASPPSNSTPSAAPPNPPNSEPGPGWHNFSNPPQQQPNDPQANDPQGNYPPSNYPQGNYPPSNYPQGNYPPPNYSQGNYPPPNQPLPATVNLRAGVFVTVRIDQILSSDKNQPGDGFSATLVRPLIADGVIVAQQGQYIGGKVTEAQKAGRVKGVSHLGVQLTDLTLVDGQQVPIKTELSSLRGPTSNGRDAAAIAGTTLMGAAIGGAADLGPGAAIGAGAGLIASTVGVLLTRGRPTVLYPETLLTFRLSAPITISTEHAPQAFQMVGPGGYAGGYHRGYAGGYNGGYGGGPAAQGAPLPGSGWNCLGYGWPAPPVANAPAPYYSPYPYGYWPSFNFWYGPGFYGHGFYGRGFYYRR
jgi:hypothetical protein